MGGQQLAAGDDAGRERADLHRHADDFRNRTGFTYTVLDPESRNVSAERRHLARAVPRRDLVCSPCLLEADVKTVDQMQSVSALCCFVELGATSSRVSPRRPPQCAFTAPSFAFTTQLARPRERTCACVGARILCLRASEAEWQATGLFIKTRVGEALQGAITADDSE
jgi:hypothetical protein